MCPPTSQFSWSVPGTHWRHHSLPAVHVLDTPAPHPTPSAHGRGGSQSGYPSPSCRCLAQLTLAVTLQASMSPLLGPLLGRSNVAGP